MIFTEIVTLSIDSPSEGNDGSVVSALGCGTCFDFNKQQDHIFLVCTEEGKIQIKPLFIESSVTKANHQLLQNISHKFGGKMFYPKELKQLSKDLSEDNDITSVIYEEEDLKELINMKWIFFILIALLSLEWFLRKRNGAY